jgi:hypothetical protein
MRGYGAIGIKIGNPACWQSCHCIPNGSPCRVVRALEHLYQYQPSMMVTDVPIIEGWYEELVHRFNEEVHGNAAISRLVS